LASGRPPGRTGTDAPVIEGQDLLLPHEQQRVARLHHLAAQGHVRLEPVMAVCAAPPNPRLIHHASACAHVPNRRAKERTVSVQCMRLCLCKYVCVRACMRVVVVVVAGRALVRTFGLDELHVAVGGHLLPQLLDRAAAALSAPAHVGAANGAVLLHKQHAHGAARLALCPAHASRAQRVDRAAQTRHGPVQGTLHTHTHTHTHTR
jgi:hypothetical protein